MNLSQWRRLAVQRNLWKSDSLTATISRLGFVQADPIRAPARAQDLILRVRYPGYRAGQLEKQYAALDLIEDMLHVYGFLPRAMDAALHPRRVTRVWHFEGAHPRLRKSVLDHVRRHDATHPRDLHEAFGRIAVANGWGQESAVTTRMLEALHYEGRLEVVGREGGIKIYGPVRARGPAVAPGTRAATLMLLLAGLYGPVAATRLRRIFNMLGERAPGGADALRIIERLVKEGRLAASEHEGQTLVWPAEEKLMEADPDRVVLLAPFDPLVWDRERFERLWGWRYRFEAYTPPKARTMGYYAMPLLWRDKVIGWANLQYRAGVLDCETGFSGAAPRGAAFGRALEAELASIRSFLEGDEADT